MNREPLAWCGGGRGVCSPATASGRAQSPAHLSNGAAADRSAAAHGWWRVAVRMVVALGLLLMAAGCGTLPRHGLPPAAIAELDLTRARDVELLPTDLQDRILALNPTNVTEADVRDVLSRAPAPRVINIHGGVAHVIPRMVSFSEFLMGMGYPSRSLTNPSDGTYSFSCYERSAMIAGMIAWFYEQEGLRPMLVGHSQGGIQVVKVLYQLARRPRARLRVWNPLTWQREDRWEITDPLTGRKRPVAGLVLPYATSVGAGGLTRVLPNQWDMNLRLRTIPDSVEEFTGFCKANDVLGGDFLGYGPANHYRPAGRAVVRNVWLPAEYKHGEIPDTRHLLASRAMRDWINNYRPAPGTVVVPELDARFDADARHILWAAEVWYHIKKHWVLELQRLIRARRAAEHER